MGEYILFTRRRYGFYPDLKHNLLVLDGGCVTIRKKVLL